MQVSLANYSTVIFHETDSLARKACRFWRVGKPRCYWYGLFYKLGQEYQPST